MGVAPYTNTDTMNAYSALPAALPVAVNTPELMQPRWNSREHVASSNRTPTSLRPCALPARRDGAVNRFDVRAIGWVVTRDACAEIARALFGARRQVAVEALRSLGKRWLAVLACLREDARVASGNLLQPLRTALSPKSEEAVNDFVLHMVSCCPQRYSEPVLRGRCLSAAAQAFVGLVGGTTAGSFATPERMFFGDMAIVLLVMTCGSLISAIHLWRTYRIVKRLNRPTVIEASRPGPSAPSSSDRPSPMAARTDTHECSNRQ
jgi:hypothetical protein